MPYSYLMTSTVLYGAQNHSAAHSMLLYSLEHCVHSHTDLLVLLEFEIPETVKLLYIGPRPKRKYDYSSFVVAVPRLWSDLFIDDPRTRSQISSLLGFAIIVDCQLLIWKHIPWSAQL